MKLLRIGKKGYEIPVVIDKNGKYRNLSSHISDLNPDTINFETLDILKNINLENLDETITPFQHPDTNSSWHLFVIQIPGRKKVFEELMRSGIQAQVHYIPVTSQPFYNRKSLKNGENFYENCLSLPIYFDLTEEQYKRVVSCIRHD